ncbi:bifunctional 4-hydroxy-2-oxoglutarate aldolase/2-dehydro-3-deoxy-phosphogluconate aldolase [Arthrobacter sp. zg-ZUI100]|uniref:bifunctional 4-hydroxy-2-oxoglutarate aldolase/2-dehydro-3-deoxy-phosphogluconate aldolase n=1 Tax=Arthrobacter jiangjiafuii TaxID=2817475 RepID=UPI001AEEBF2C|nr:bifunctional 4-hydroxy-2-oxoglutarate aldolase/2-dehydro-3-deoxy-phosphogluconate aldolase [Arthrobacter jiangjiafuii]MBP3035125.1 bifunctional 4-hydroxy-2-oxoglutarate aldolase/2-dehydro-3-deoxy-phosphogluconate aldolase [Arthrobacter jiangjiafuii]
MSVNPLQTAATGPESLGPAAAPVHQAPAPEDPVQAWLSALAASPVIAVLRARHASEYGPVLEALIEGGVLNIELTLSTAGVLDALPELVSRYGTRARIGVGTVTDTAEVAPLAAAGAAFLVTPVTDTAIVRAAVDAGIPIVPGGLTPSELFAGVKAGAPAVKVFPASVVGPGYLSQLRGPFPDIQVIPSGGIGVDDAGAWLRAGALAVSVGGPLLQDAFSGGSLTALSKRARRLSSEAAAALETRGLA